MDDRQAFPASYGQERLWFMARRDPDVPAYNLPMEMRVPPQVDVALVTEALRQVVGRHETLRTDFSTDDDGRLRQVVHDTVPVVVEVADLRGEPEPDQALDDLRTRCRRTPFTLAEAPLWRVVLARLDEHEQRLLVVAHHAVCDAWSIGNLQSELEELFAARFEGREPELPELEIQYVDYAVWQRRELATGELAASVDYWRERLAGLPDQVPVPSDRPRPAQPTHAGGEQHFALPAGTVAGLEALARRHQTTTYTILLAGLKALLYRLSGQRDVVVGSSVAGRSMPELEPLIGMFVNTLVLRTDVDGAACFAELVDRLRDGLLADFEHQDVPFDRVVEAVAPTRDPGRNPLYQIAFNRVPAEGVQLSTGTAKFDLLWEIDNRYQGRLEYSADLFDPGTAATLVQRYLRLLAAAVADPELPVDRLPLLDEAERHRLTGSGRHAAPTASVLFPARFDEWVSRRADAPAVTDSQGGRLGYAELAARADALAALLRGHGVGPEQRVGILVDNRVELAVAVLGVLRAGGAYVPLDLRSPADRLKRTLADAGALVAVTVADLAPRLDGAGVPVLRVEEAVPGTPPHAVPPATPAVEPESLAYVVYTSGSTGAPKGVAVSHRNLAAYLAGLTELLAAPPGRVFSLWQPLTFDFGLTMFYGALASGGTVHLVDAERVTDPAWLAAHVASGVDYLKLTPSHLSSLVAAGAEPTALLPRQALLLGGEASLWSQVTHLRELAGDRMVINHYGPTETTVGALALPGDRTPTPRGATTPIGWPLAGATAYVLDERLDPVPDGVVGELYVGGETVSRGYLGQPGRTAERYLPDPFADRPGARLYRTGDRCRRLPDGAVEFLGRLDDQVKLHGYRIELDEVRAVIAGCPEVADCAVLLDEERRTGPALVCYVVPARPDVPPAVVRRHAERHLPDFMVPAAFVPLAELPLTPHGKLDRRRLPAVPDVVTQVRTDRPRDAVEDVVATVFGTLLHRDEIGRDDHFFELGGHSLLVIQLLARLRAAFGVDLPLRSVFEAPTVRGLARWITGFATGGGTPPVAVADRSRPLPASYGQRRLWLSHHTEPDPQLYNTHFGLELVGPLDPAAVRAALVTVAQRHEVLRTRFVLDGGELCQVAGDTAEVPWREVDLRGLVGDELESAHRRHYREHGEPVFDLRVDPPLRALLLRIADDRHELLLTLHHAVFDGSSMAVMLTELAAAYPAARTGRPVALPPLPVQYADFAVWQRDLVTGSGGGQLDYWRERLAGLPARLELPTDRPRPRQRGSEGAHELFEVPGEVADRLRRLAAAEGATLNMALLAGYFVLLARYTGDRDLVVGVPHTARPRPELEPLIGFFVNTLVLRVDVGAAQTFRDLLRQVRDVTIGAYAHADVPFEALVDELSPPRDPGSTPLVQTMFMLADDDRALSVDSGEVTMRYEPFALPMAKFDVSVFLWRRADRLDGAMQYRRDLFDPSTMARFAADYTALLTAVADAPETLAEEVAATAPAGVTAGATPSVDALVPAGGGALRVTEGADGRWRDVPARLVADRVAWLCAGAPAGAAETVLHVLPPGTVTAAVELLWPVAAGGRVVPLDPAVGDAPPVLAEALRAHRASSVALTPARLAGLLDLPHLALPDLVAVRCVGGPLSPALAARCADRLPGVLVDDLFDLPAQGVLASRRVTGSAPPGLLGRPAGVRLEVLDDRLRRVPTGAVGQLWVAGPAGDPDAGTDPVGDPDTGAGPASGPDTGAGPDGASCPDPYGAPGDRLVATGELVRWRADGDLEYHGRIAEELARDGYRIRPALIAQALLGEPGVRAATVAVRPDGDVARLVAYLVGEPDTDVERVDWTARLRGRLADGWIPDAVVTLPAIVEDRAGRWAYAALPEPTEASVPDDAPHAGTEEVVAGVLAELLDRPTVRRHDDLFALGGHSLLVIRLVARLRAVFGVEVPIRAVFEAPTPAGLAERIAGLTGAAALPPVRPVDRAGPSLASYGQRRLWFLDQLDPGSPLYNTQLLLRLRGDLDRDALRAALGVVVRRHEVLRSRLVLIDDDVHQVVVDDAPPALDEVDVSGRPAEVRDAELWTLLRAHAAVPFDLATDAPLRALLVRVAADEHLLLVTLHHAVSDAPSMDLLVEELSVLYAGGSADDLPRLAVQYADFALWQRDLLTGVGAGQLAYWRERLAGLPARLELPADRARPAQRSTAGAHAPLHVDAHLVERLRVLAAGEGGTLFMALLGGFYTLLSRYTGQTDLAVGVPVAGRGQSELEPLIGFFLNTLVLRTDLDGDPTFRDLLTRVRETTVGAFAHRDVPFELLAGELAEGRELGTDPLVQALFSVEEERRAAPPVAGLAVERLPLGTAAARFDLSVLLWRDGDGLSGTFEYRTDLVSAELAARLTRHYLALLDAAATAPDVPLSRLPFTAPDEPAPAVSGVSRVFGVGSLVDVVGGVGVGLVGSWGVVSGVEFGSRVRRLGRLLVGLGVGVDSVVGVCVERGVGLVVGVHGVVAAGGAYVPLEPSLPDERLGVMVADSGAGVVVTSADLADRVSGVVGAGVRVVVLGEEMDCSDGPLGVVVPGEGLAYVIYTSGSTGRPKGVGVSHRSIWNRLWWMQDEFGLSVDDRVLVKTPFSFDVSVWELFWPSLVGASMVVADPGVHRDSAALLGLVESERVTTVHFVPSMLDAFLAEPGVGVRAAGLRRVFCSGEALGADVVRRFFEVLPGVELFNLYGPTEAAVDVTWHRCLPGGVVVPIGRPVANTRVEVLDSGLGRVPVGVPGELCIGGVQVGRGYVGRAGWTAERFVPDPFGGVGGRLYRTGDVARWRPDGSLEFLGRSDGQVKVRGFRIETGEVEAALEAVSGVRSAVVVARGEGAGVRLVGYVVAEVGVDVSGVDWRVVLGRGLPEYAVPAQVVVIDELPTTVNGKLDRSALPDPGVTRTDHTPPRNPTEQLLAGIWCEVLGLTEVGVHDNFFHLGGDSISSLRVIARLRTAGHEVSLPQLFRHQTVAALAEAIGAVGTVATDAGAPEGDVTGLDDSDFGLLGAGDLDVLDRLYGDSRGASEQ
ncbi:amino acid adenylation domain-containing protein [Micromonospora sp. NPDC047074]|uniref:non-ribosomal peptide synthetase n=1 Tax=Micromonospora sp. NPDC047074 TaxID=3154339 RepID=UPI0033D27E66